MIPTLNMCSDGQGMMGKWVGHTLAPFSQKKVLGYIKVSGVSLLSYLFACFIILKCQFNIYENKIKTTSEQ